MQNVSQQVVAAAGQGAVPPARAWTMLAALSLLFVVSMVDRFALGLLVQPLQHDLGVSDVQLGFLFGSTFAILYGAITFPLARWADRGNRVWLIFFAVVLWAASTILSGFATSFAMLVVLRIGLAVGEAALVPAVFSLIGDLLPKNRRTFGAALFNAFGMAGAAGAYLIGSLAIGFTYAIQANGHFVDFRIWQAVFILVGLPGLLLALVFASVAKEPVRATTASDIEAASFGDVLRYARGQGWLYPGLFLGAGCLQWGTNGFLAWSPTYLSRAFGLSIVEAGRLFGVTNLIAFIGGSLVIPLIGGWIGRSRRDGVILVTATCALLSSLFCVAAVLQPSPFGFLLCAFVGLFSAVGGASHVIASVHMLTPAGMRATFIAALLICLTTIALGVAPPAVGALSSHFGSGKGALGVGLGIVSAVGGSIAIALLLRARARILLYLTAAQEDFADTTVSALQQHVEFLGERSGGEGATV